jgi:hypothetical protein
LAQGSRYTLVWLGGSASLGSASAGCAVEFETVTSSRPKPTTRARRRDRAARAP